MEASKTKGKRGTTYCSALNCTSNKFDNKDLSFFRFPKDVNRLVVVKSVTFHIPRLKVNMYIILKETKRSPLGLRIFNNYWMRLIDQKF